MNLCRNAYPPALQCVIVCYCAIFFRGAGEMMTRCPIMVTLSEGPNHVASFKGTEKEFDLSDDSEVCSYLLS